MAGLVCRAGVAADVVVDLTADIAANVAVGVIVAIAAVAIGVGCFHRRIKQAIHFLGQCHQLLCLIFALGILCIEDEKLEEVHKIVMKIIFFSLGHCRKVCF